MDQIPQKPPMLLVILHLGGVVDSVTPAVRGDDQSLHVIASSYVVVVDVEILRLVELLLTAVVVSVIRGLNLSASSFLLLWNPSSAVMSSRLVII